MDQRDNLARQIDCFALKIKEKLHEMASILDRKFKNISRFMKPLSIILNIIMYALAIYISLKDLELDNALAYMQMFTFCIVWPATLVTAFIAGSYRMLPIWFIILCSIITNAILCLIYVPKLFSSVKPDYNIAVTFFRLFGAIFSISALHLAALFLPTALIWAKPSCKQ